MMKLRRRIRPATGKERTSRNSFAAIRTICRKLTCVAATHHPRMRRSRPCDLPLLRVQAGRAQADDGHGPAVWHDRQRILPAIREHWTS
nr:MAG TPA: hypothetical protein [Caudoviricetes sp.]